jgi:transglutaminase-like putative cysteine protease
VDADAVNTSALGTYPVTYTATDASGNSSSVTVNLTVRERVYDINEVDAIADSVLARITNDQMTLYDKALAIFNYTKGHISYINSSDKGNWVKAAYEGLVDGRGDCYVYASTAKELLTRAGITNMDIERIPSGNSMHYWNLVDIGTGWYHFDTTPRTDHPVIFMWTDAQIREYSNSHNNSHNYDPANYPQIN